MLIGIFGSRLQSMLGRECSLSMGQCNQMALSQEIIAALTSKGSVLVSMGFGVYLPAYQSMCLAFFQERLQPFLRSANQARSERSSASNSLRLAADSEGIE